MRATWLVFCLFVGLIIGGLFNMRLAEVRQTRIEKISRDSRASAVMHLDSALVRIEIEVRRQGAVVDSVAGEMRRSMRR